MQDTPIDVTVSPIGVKCFYVILRSFDSIQFYGRVSFVQRNFVELKCMQSID